MSVPNNAGPVGQPLLEAKSITKEFPGVLALDNVSFDLRPGEIHALCGENGAGKSTLIKTLSGIHPAGSYDGSILIDGREANFHSIRDAEKSGVAVIYQELALVPEMTVAENIFLGHEPTKGPWIDWHKIYTETQNLLTKYGLEVSPTALIKDLGVGQQQLVEIVKALARNSRILILDEPTSALTEHETAILTKNLNLLREEGIGCIYISHKLDEVFDLADRITVLRDGQSIITKPASEITRDEMIRHMVGREINDLFPEKTGGGKETILKVTNLSASPETGAPAFLQNISFELRAGEVLGIGGLMGAGRSELAMHLLGFWGSRTEGSVTFKNETLNHPTPRECLRKGMVMVSEDRKKYGLILENTIGFNLSLSELSQKTNAPWTGIDLNSEFKNNRQQFDALRVKATSLETDANTLSGGNQQKIVIGKALMTEPQLIILDEPTRGIDIGAKAEIYNIIHQLTEEGKAVLLISSELPELIGMSDRILMMHEGKFTGEFQLGEATQESLMHAAMGHKPASI